MDYFQFLIIPLSLVFLILVLGFAGYFLFRAIDSFKEKKYGGVVFWLLALIAILLFIWMALPDIVKEFGLVQEPLSPVDVITGCLNIK